jgi:ATP adenylyltransferase
VQQLWAPWRLAYIKNGDGEEGCFLCRGADGPDDEANLVVDRTALSFAILNRFPYNNGHLMVAPRQHKGELDDLSEEELLDLMRLVRHWKGALSEVLQPQGFNIGMNLGGVAGAGLPGHLHIHIVPRWQGDTNFMPVVGATKVISQSLEDLYDSLRPYAQKPDNQR